MKKQEISIKEYQHIIERLAFIEEEENHLKKFACTLNQKVSGIDSFSSFLLYLKRENNYIEEEIHLEKLKFLSSFRQTNPLYQEVQYQIEEYLVFLSHSFQMVDPTTRNLDFKKFEWLCQFPMFEQFQKKVIEFIRQREANLYFITYISSLLEEQNQLLSKKIFYQKKRKKNRKTFLV